MNEMIGQVKLNLEYYTGVNQYSDGEIEIELLEIVKNTNDYSDVLINDDRWPILYHLSPIRHNLLDWIPFREEATLLEVGAGCGALTGLLTDKVNKVVAVELSMQRAEINAYRHKDKSNLEIIVGNLEDIHFEEKFDYICLIGVLEYAGKYSNSSTENPYCSFLKSLKKLLKPGGILVIAIENKFGLKYWAGADEDHTGRVFDGLENYPDDQGIRTFGKNEITELIKKAGFNQLQFYYPMPDYKLPDQLYSDDFLPEMGQMRVKYPNYDRERLILFDEQLVFDGLTENNQIHFFANSFLIICN